MRKHVLAVGAVVAVIVAAVVSLTSGREGGAALTTPWGDPDLQGLWASAYSTPLQRPAQYADKEFFTEEELAKLKNRGASDTPRRSAPSERPTPGTIEDLMGAYDPEVFSGTDSSRPVGRRTSLIVDPPDGRIPARTPEVDKRNREMREYQLALLQSVEQCKTSQEIACFGVKYTGQVSPKRFEPPPHYLAATIFGERVINRSDGPEDFGLSERCLSGQLPNIGGVHRIVQSPEAVSIVYEGWHRLIPITARAHLPGSVRLWRGDARARWEGATLVVDTANFTPKTDYQGSRENLHLVERFTRVDATMLDYEVTLEDPTAWTKPWTIKIEMAMQDQRANQIYDEPRCHDGNHAMTAMLIGARVDDVAFAEKRGPDPATMCYLICGGRCTPGRPGCPPAQ